MDINFDKHAVELGCPACGHKFQETLGRLKNDPTVDCPNCHAPIKIAAEGLRKGLDSANKAIADLDEAIKGFGNRR